MLKRNFKLSSRMLRGGNSFDLECLRDINSLEWRPRYCANGHAKNHLSLLDNLSDEDEVINLQIITSDLSIILQISANRKMFLVLHACELCFFFETLLLLTSFLLLSNIYRMLEESKILEH